MDNKKFKDVKVGDTIYLVEPETIHTFKSTINHYKLYVIKVNEITERKAHAGFAHFDGRCFIGEYIGYKRYNEDVVYIQLGDLDTMNREKYGRKYNLDESIQAYVSISDGFAFTTLDEALEYRQTVNQIEMNLLENECKQILKSKKEFTKKVDENTYQIKTYLKNEKML